MNHRGYVPKSEVHTPRAGSIQMDTIVERHADRCPAEATIEVIGGRWKVPIVWHLFAGTRRFGELRKALPGVTQKMLTQQLRELERDGVVERRVYAEVPPRVEYSLTNKGHALLPVIESMRQFGTRWLPADDCAHDNADVEANVALPLPSLAITR